MLTWLVEYWQFTIGTAIALVSIAIAIATIVYQGEPKQLDYEVRSDHQMLSPHTRYLAPKPDVIYEGVALKDPQILILRFRNTGKKSISATDFINGEPITIRYERNPPLDAKIVRPSRGMDVERLADIAQDIDGQEGDGSVRITPRLLLEGEWFDVQL
jgi:hypothetical protein